MEEVVVSAGGGDLVRRVEVTDVYCPSCGCVAERDTHGKVKSSVDEMRRYHGM